MGSGEGQFERPRESQAVRGRVRASIQVLFKVVLLGARRPVENGLYVYEQNKHGMPAYLQ